jgi:hypothetical protein
MPCHNDEKTYSCFCWTLTSSLGSLSYAHSSIPFPVLSLPSNPIFLSADEGRGKREREYRREKEKRGVRRSSFQNNFFFLNQVKYIQGESKLEENASLFIILRHDEIIFE